MLPPLLSPPRPSPRLSALLTSRPAESSAVLELVPPGTLRDRLVDAVLRGAKTATTRLSDVDDAAGFRLTVGQAVELHDSLDMGVATLRITQHRRLSFSEVGLDVALAEGDWFADVEQWRTAHRRYFTAAQDDARAAIGDPTWEFTDDTLVDIYFFEVEHLQ